MSSPGNPQRVSFLEAVRSDFDGFLALDTERSHSLRRRLDVLTQPGFLAGVLFRISQSCVRLHLDPIAQLVYLWNVMLFGADLSQRAFAGPGLVIVHPVGVSIDAGVRLGKNVRIHKGVTVGAEGIDAEDLAKGVPSVGDGVRLFDGCKLLGPIEVGEGALIGTNCLVTRSIPAYAVVATGSAKVIRRSPGGKNEGEEAID
jgi:serine O-acetyltransferase